MKYIIWFVLSFTIAMTANGFAEGGNNKILSDIRSISMSLDSSVSELTRSENIEKLNNIINSKSVGKNERFEAGMAKLHASGMDSDSQWQDIRNLAFQLIDDSDTPAKSARSSLLAARLALSADGGIEEDKSTLFQLAQNNTLAYTAFAQEAAKNPADQLEVQHINGENVIIVPDPQRYHTEIAILIKSRLSDLSDLERYQEVIQIAKKAEVDFFGIQKSAEYESHDLAVIQSRAFYAAVRSKDYPAAISTLDELEMNLASKDINLVAFKNYLLKVSSQSEPEQIDIIEKLLMESSQKELAFHLRLLEIKRLLQDAKTSDSIAKSKLLLTRLDEMESLKILPHVEEDILSEYKSPKSFFRYKILYYLNAALTEDNRISEAKAIGQLMNETKINKEK